MDSGKKSFLWLVAVFVTPVVLGTILFFNLERLGFQKGSVNYGQLVHPALPLKADGLQQANTDAILKETILKKWTLVYINRGATCDKTCQDKLLLIKRVRLLTNEKMRRVRTLIIADNAEMTGISMSDYPDLVMSNHKSAQFYEQFPETNKNPVYLLDPLGNLMMYYPQEDPSAKKMIKDINRLLKYSHLG